MCVYFKHGHYNHRLRRLRLQKTFLVYFPVHTLIFIRPDLPYKQISRITNALNAGKKEEK